MLAKVLMTALLGTFCVCQARAKTCSDIVKALHSPELLAAMQSTVPIDPSNLADISPNQQPLKFTVGQLTQTVVVVCVVDASNGQGDTDTKEATAHALAILENFAALKIDPLN